MTSLAFIAQYLPELIRNLSWEVP